MLSCRRVKGPLIFVSVLMHRETNLQVENEETIEAQSARTPKRCWTESNSAFSFGARISVAGATSECRQHSAPLQPRLSRLRRFHPFRWSIAAGAHTRALPSGLTRLACVKSVRYTQLSPTVRSGKRQFSYKQNAEEGVLDEKRGTMDRGARGGWRRSCGVGDARVCVGAHEPSCGRHARSGAVCRHDGARGRCVGIRSLVRVRMNGRFFDPALPACGAEPGRAGRPAGDRCVRIDRMSRNAAFLRFIHPDDIAAAHRGGRTAVSACAATRTRGIAGAGWRRGVSRENERRRGTAR